MKKALTAVSFCVLMLALLLSGCGGQAAKEGTSGQGKTEDKEIHWQLKETLLPDADEALKDVLGEQGIGFEMLYGMAGDTVYRIVQMSGEDQAYRGICIQKLEAPYTSWENFPILTEEWVEDAYGYVWQAALGQDDSVHILLESMEQEGKRSYYIANWTEQEGKKLERVPDGNLEEETVHGISLLYVDGKGTLYLVTEKGLTCFDKTFSEKKDRTDIVHIWQIAENPGIEGQAYLCGYSAEGASGIWPVEEKNPLVTGGWMSADGTGRIVFSGETEGYLCTTEGIWQFHTKEKETENLVDFREQGYTVDRILGAHVREDGSLLVLLADDEEYIMLETRGDGQAEVQYPQALEQQNPIQQENQEPADFKAEDKVELELAVTFPSAFLKETVVDFNRHNEEYYIVLRSPENGESYTDFQARIQAELSSGGGPALLSGDVIELQNAAGQGLLRNLTADFAEQKAAVAENVWASGEVDGVSYGIPYSFSVLTFVTTMDVAGDKESWTSEEMMQCVRESGAKTAVSNVNSALLFSILVSRGNLIDWESGKSYLNSEEAVALLAFAAEYGDKEPDVNVGARIEEGEMLVLYENISGLFWAKGYVALFHGKEAYIGLPTEEEGRGSILEGDTISINQACVHPEGAIAFIKYLLSEESQERFAKETSGFGVDGFPATSQALESMFRYVREEEHEEASKATFRGYECILEPLDEESLEKIRKLLEHAEPEKMQTDAISAILLEETPAYFSGNKSAQEVCDIIQNRVQLYLDERH